MFDARRICLAVAAMLALLAAVPEGAAANGPVRFQATTKETVVVVPCDPNVLCLSITGSGHATHLGTIRESAHYKVDLLSTPAPGCNAATGTMTLTGDTGDSISLTLNGWGCQSSPTTATNVLVYAVTGGTGRLSGATGYGTETVFVDLTDPTAPIPRAFFDGSLSTPGSL